MLLSNWNHFMWQEKDLFCHPSNGNFLMFFIFSPTSGYHDAHEPNIAFYSNIQWLYPLHLSLKYLFSATSGISISVCVWVHLGPFILLGNFLRPPIWVILLKFVHGPNTTTAKMTKKVNCIHHLQNLWLWHLICLLRNERKNKRKLPYCSSTIVWRERMVIF